MKITAPMAAAIAARIIAGEPTPKPGAEMTDQHNMVSAIVEVAAPTISIELPLRCATEGGINHKAEMITIQAIGTLIKKIDPQPKFSNRIPDSNGPAAPPAPFAMDHQANAWVRSLGLVNKAETKAKVDGASKAAPHPIIDRAIINKCVVCTIPAISEKMPKTKVPVMNVRRRPQRSTREPAINNKPA